MRKIVHTDNSEFFRRLVRTFLAEQGFEGVSYDQGSMALEAVKGGDVALVITGISLPDMNGEDFIRQIVPYKIPVIVLTADESPEKQRALEDLGIKAYILKAKAWQEKLLPYLNAL
ncbi:MAG: response regulator [Treponema sp.]|jgi:DNA-binding response OmpR family regulator|nr:response regulator [Treponema sp.]